MKLTLAHAQFVRLSVPISRAVPLSWFLFACGLGPVGEIFPPPAVEELGLTEKERAAYSPITFDKFVGALEIAADDSEAVEMVIKKVKRKTIGWSGVVQSTRIVKKGLEISEFSLNVAPPSQAGAVFPKTYPVLIRAPNGDPTSKLEKGTPIVFVGRLEFDGLSRKPGVMDSRLIEIAAKN
ncbi:MAG: hypothetical protein AAEJ52_13695 [Myxococcota bacterium]